ncbi:MAG: acylphosphatase [Planctomycetales bacterium]|nr:acylphosphatase [Planctomycetales bacterium]
MRELREALYSGHVQGVGFRATVQRIAARYAVAGYVRNLPDGRVQLVAEGESQTVEEFLRAVTDAMDGYIRNAQVDVRQASGNYGHFEIRV